MENSKLSINICFPCKAAKIKVNENHKIELLSNLFPQDFYFISNGTLLDLQKTFLDYGVKSNDTIFAIFKSQNPEAWLRFSQDQEYIQEKMNYASNLQTREQFSRLRDLHMMRAEQKCKYLYKLQSKIPTYCPVQKKFPTCLPTEKILSVAPLPDPWDTSDVQSPHNCLNTRQASCEFNSSPEIPGVLESDQ